jgi:hypothetical protein
VDSKRELEILIEEHYYKLQLEQKGTEQYIRIREQLGSVSLLYKIEYNVFYNEKWLQNN